MKFKLIIRERTVQLTAANGAVYPVSLNLHDLAYRYFSPLPPTDAQWEEAIMTVEDAIAPLQKLMPSEKSLSIDVSDLDGLTQYPTLQREAVEQIFQQLSRYGRCPELSEQPLTYAKFLLIREFLHHMDFAQAQWQATSNQGKRNIALIPAAGVGARFGAGKPKQYVEINGKTVLQHTVSIFEQHEKIDYIAVIVSPEDSVFQTASDKVGVFKVGGETRAETVRNGVKTLLEQGFAAEHDNILVHDAARCCLPSEALSRLIDEAGNIEQGGILAVPVADTLKRAGAENQISETVPRAGLWQAQTPQLFQTALLHQALSAEDLSKVTDEASAVEQLGIQPLLVLGDTRNLKLTLPQDEFIVRLLLEQK